MKPTDLVYEIARHYVSDHSSHLSPENYNLILGKIRARDLQALATCSCYFDWQSHTVNEWRVLRQVEAFFKKNDAFVEESVCEAAARRSFMNAEADCLRTNLKLREYVCKTHLLPKEVAEPIHRARTYIKTVLGDTTRFINELPALVRVTPGATANSSRVNSLPQLKMTLKPWGTKKSVPYIRSLYHYFGFDTVRVKPINSNRVELVPKNYKTHRTIACEPDGMLPLQLAFDGWCKKRLRLHHIDLSDQSKNKNLARKASIDGSLATVDFSAASDTISYNTVALLFPVEWLKLLDAWRTPCYRGAFGRGVYHKFSSMGNGSTFCIETLIFAACCHAVGGQNFNVYGDDVIIETEKLEAYRKLTHFLGFTINMEKSFATGPFRESCGGDYFDGVNVTPTYLRTVPRRKADWCHLVNTMATLSYPGGKLAECLVKITRDEKLPLVPWNLSTLSGVWIDPDEAYVTKKMFRSVKCPLTIKKMNKLWFIPKFVLISKWFRKLGLFTFDGYIDYYKAYIPKSSKRKFVDSRGYYLWFLNRNRQVSFGGPWGCRNVTQSGTSQVPVFQHKYVRKRVVWRRPDEGIPGHLSWWSKLVTRIS